MLQMQYWTHKRLNDGTNHVIYDDQLISNPSIENRPFLQQLLTLMPLNFEYNNKFFGIRSYLDFVNVDNGEEVALGRNQYNIAEIEAIVTMLTAMKTEKAGMPLSNIATVTAYALQFFKTKACFAFNDKTRTRLWHKAYETDMTLTTRQ